MSESTHKLKIIPQLDTSQLQGQLNQINQQRAASSSGSGAPNQNPNAAFSSLDRTLQSLNRTLQQLIRFQTTSMQRQEQTASRLSAQAASGGGDASGLGASAALQQTLHAQHPGAETYAQHHLTTRVFPAVSRLWKKLGPERQELFQYLNAGPLGFFNLAHSTGAVGERTPDQIKRISAADAYQISLDVIKQRFDETNPKYKEAIEYEQKYLADYNQWQRNRQSISIANKIKWGAIGHMAGSYFGQLGGIAEEAGYYGTSTGLGIAGAAMAGAGMGGAVAGPWGAAVGGLASAALECVKALQEFKRVTEENAATFTKFNQVERNRLDFAGISKTTDFMQLMPGSTFSQILQDRIARQEEYRDEAASQILLAASSTTMNAKEKAQAMKAQQNIYQQAIQQLQVLNQMLDAANKKSDDLFEEQRQIRWIEQGAHDEWMSNIAEQQDEASLRRHASMLDYQAYRTANRHAYRAAIKSYNQGIASRDMWIADQSTAMEQEALVAGISGQWRTGNMSDYLDKAKSARQRMKTLLGEISTTGDLARVSELQQQYQRESTQFSNAMTVANMLKPEGNPLQRIALENLTSLAGRGGWMGEKYNTDRTFEKLNEMATSLRNIDDNTREQFKAVYD